MVSTWGTVISRVKIDVAPSTRLNIVSERVETAGSGAMALLWSIPAGAATAGAKGGSAALAIAPTPARRLTSQPTDRNERRDENKHIDEQGPSFRFRREYQEAGAEQGGECNHNGPALPHYRQAPTPP